MKVLADIYASWVPKDKIITMNLWSSELSKLAANAMLAQKLSSINALSAICEATGADIDEVTRACGMDKRLGNKFWKVSLGFGGSCFRKDVNSLVYLAESLHLPEVAEYWKQVAHFLLKAVFDNKVNRFNDFQTSRFTDSVVKTLFNTLNTKTIALFGFSFKKNTGDVRESAAIKMAQNFILEGAIVNVYDPKAKKESILQALLAAGISSAQRTHPNSVNT
jgi:UDPglucose 6-dehydrogenase